MSQRPLDTRDITSIHVGGVFVIVVIVVESTCIALIGRLRQDLFGEGFTGSSKAKLPPATRRENDSQDTL